MNINWKLIKDNIKHLPSTIAGLALLLSLVPQNEAVQKMLALSPHFANFFTETTVIVCGLSAIFAVGQKIFGSKDASK